MVDDEIKKLKKILLIDDDEMSNYLNRRILEKMEIVEHIDNVNDGQAGLEYVADYCSRSDFNEFPDIIFLDINMPVIDGFEFLNQLQKIEGIDLKKLYVIMLTSSTDPKDIEEAAKYPEIVKGYIKKPLMKEHLTKILEYF